MKNRKITLKYMFMQAIYWGTVCSILGYTVTYMKDLGYSNSYIGVALAIANGVSAVMQPLIANIADKNPKWTIVRVNTVLSILMLIGSAAMIVYKSATLILTLLIGVITVVNGLIQPFLNSLAVALQKNGINLNYGVCRAAGSLFYAIVSSILGELLTVFPSRILPVASTILCALLLVAAIMNKVDVSAESEEDKSEETALKKTEATPLLEFIAKNKRFSLYVVGVSLVFYMHMVMTTYLIQIVENVGGDSSNMGFSLGLAAALELPAMIGFNFIVKKIKVQTLLRISAVSFTVKALAMTLATNPGMIYAAQIIQMTAFALYIPSSVYYVGHLFKNSDMNKGQSMSTMTLTVGSFFSSLFTGYLIDKYSVNTMMWISLAVSVVGTVIMIATIQEFDDDFDVKSCGETV